MKPAAITRALTRARTTAWQQGKQARALQIKAWATEAREQDEDFQEMKWQHEVKEWRAHQKLQADIMNLWLGGGQNWVTF